MQGGAGNQKLKGDDMKRIRIALLILAVVALTLPLAGCPKGKKMMGDATQPVSVEDIG